MAEIQVRVFDPAALLEKLLAQHVRRFVGLLGLVHQDFAALPVPAGPAALRYAAENALQRREISIFGIFKNVPQPVLAASS